MDVLPINRAKFIHDNKIGEWSFSPPYLVGRATSLRGQFAHFSISRAAGNASLKTQY